MSEARSGGIGVTGLLGVTFIILKLCGVIAWSWWWVLSPFWIPLAIIGAVLLVLLGIACVAAVVGGERVNLWRRRP